MIGLQRSRIRFPELAVLNNALAAGAPPQTSPWEGNGEGEEEWGWRKGEGGERCWRRLIYPHKLLRPSPSYLVDSYLLMTDSIKLLCSLAAAKQRLPQKLSGINISFACPRFGTLRSLLCQWCADWFPIQILFVILVRFITWRQLTVQLRRSDCITNVHAHVSLRWLRMLL